MNNVLGHIVGLDEINKKLLIEKIPVDIHVIDLDKIQQKIHNGADIAKQKARWNQLSKDIILLRQHKKISGEKITQLFAKRAAVKKLIHDLWKKNMTAEITNASDTNMPYVLFVGFNIFPKDYRVKINLAALTTNRIIFETTPDAYASNQIETYINTYKNKIIRGTFPLNLLDKNYLATKYDKFTSYYYKHDYNFLPIDMIVTSIKKFIQHMISKNRLDQTNQKIYIAMPYRTSNAIPFNTKTPLEGFFTKADAINNIKSKITKNQAVYLYLMDNSQFELVDGKLYAKQQLEPIDEESMMVTL